MFKKAVKGAGEQTCSMLLQISDKNNGQDLKRNRFRRSKKFVFWTDGIVQLWSKLLSL